MKYYTTILLSLLLFSCSPDNQVEPIIENNKFEIITFGGVVNKVNKSATLIGKINTDVPNEIIQYGHCWSKNSNPTLNDEYTNFGGNFSG